MSIEWLKTKGYELPKPENNTDELPNAAIFSKICAFMEEWKKHQDECSIMDFMDLLHNYPVSMCSRDMTETLKELITILYLSTKPEDRQDCYPDWQGFSYEDLAERFVRSKATIYAAIHEKEQAIKVKLDDSLKLREKAKSIAMQQLIDEEKAKLMTENKQAEQPNERTNNLPTEVE